MSDLQSSAAPAPAPKGMARKWTFAILILAFLFVLMPFLFWQSTWFGRPLSDTELEKQLADAEHPRKVQHALVQLGERMLSPQPATRQSAKRWYPQVAALAEHKVEEVRTTAAWVMGQDNSVPEFHAALLRLLADPQPMVRRNAALALVRFGDDSGHAEIVAMLRPYAVQAPQAGTLAQRLKVGDVVNPGTLLGRVTVRKGSEESEVEIRTDVPGAVERWLEPDGAAVSAGQEIVSLSPSPSMVWEALRALVLVGGAEDLSDIERYTRPMEDMPENVRQQAHEAQLAIRKRSGQP